VPTGYNAAAGIAAVAGTVLLMGGLEFADK
jgi:hypothetical protein